MLSRITRVVPVCFPLSCNMLLRMSMKWMPCMPSAERAGGLVSQTIALRAGVRHDTP